MDVDGKAAYPTEAQLAERAAVTRETVCKKLKLADSQGFIIRKKHKPEGQKYFNYVYMLPKRFVCDSEQVTSASKSH
jgi:predicted transcriptional regulator